MKENKYIKDGKFTDDIPKFFVVKFFDGSPEYETMRIEGRDQLKSAYSALLLNGMFQGKTRSDLISGSSIKSIRMDKVRLFSWYSKFIWKYNNGEFLTNITDEDDIKRYCDQIYANFMNEIKDEIERESK